MPRGVKGSGPKKPPKKAAAKTLRAVPAKALAAPIRDDGPLGSVDVDSLAGDALRRYARRAGVSPRDVDNLTEDRLRQNTKLTIQNHFELLSEA